MTEEIKKACRWLSYIGLPTAAVIASEVFCCCVDVSEKAVATINEGKIHIVEPDRIWSFRLL